LTVTKAGSGSGTVTSSPLGINCGATCSSLFDYGTVVTLTATPATGSVFSGWSGGGCLGVGTCQVTMTAAQSVTATFTLTTHTLTVTKAGSGSGTVTSSPAGVSCGATCSAAYDYGTVVTLAATAAAGSTFTGWSGGGCSGTGTCQVTMTAAQSVTATFTLTTHTLTVTKTGSGSGTVSSSPAGISCGAACSSSFDGGATVTLTATPVSGSSFQGWSGACTGTGTCTVTMDQDRSVTATFGAQLQPPSGGPPVITGPPSVTGAGLFCGVQHRGRCTGLKIKTLFRRPGNAVWEFAAFNPSPGHSTVLTLGKAKKAITKSGQVTTVFKLKAGAGTNKLYKRVVKLHLNRIRVKLTFTPASGSKQVVTKSVKLVI